MRRSHIIITLLLLVIIWLVVITYLSGTSQQSTTPSVNQSNTDINRGLTPQTDANQLQTIEFNEAMEQLPANPFEVKGGVSNQTIRIIRGTDLDRAGRATLWMFAIEYVNQGTLLYYDGKEWKSSPWQGRLPEQPIVTGSFVPPGELFKNNAGIIFGSDPVNTAVVKRLELTDGIYTITLYRKDKQQVLSFRADTGALIP